jgi:hypothetical protein
MRDDRSSNLAERERRIQDAMRSSDDVRADPAFRDRLKRGFVEGTISEPAAPVEDRVQRRSRWWWVLAPAAAAALLFALLVPRAEPEWIVETSAGAGRIEIDGRSVPLSDEALLARAVKPGGRVRLPDDASIDVRLGDVLILALDKGSDVTLPALPDRDSRGPLISEVHDGELRIKTGPGFEGTELHILTAESRTEIVGTVISVYKGDGYTCVCVLQGTARIGADEALLEEIPSGMLKVMFDDGSPPIVAEIAAQHEADLLEFDARYENVFQTPD